jgi:hypothetical protein
MKYIFPILMAGALAVAGCQNSDQKAVTPGKGQTAPVDTKDSTTIAWIDSVHQNLGKINKGQVAEITWRFKNTGDKPLIVSNVVAGCGCTVADKPEEPIPPGGEGIIKASFDSQAQSPNNYTKTVSVFANIKNAPEHILQFSTEVVAAQ